MVYNSLYVIMSVISGILLQSAWYFIFVIYHLIFASVKFFLGLNFRYHQEKDSWKNYGRVGCFLLIAAIIFHIIVIFVSKSEDNLRPKYPMLIYVIALTTFVNLINAVINLFQFRKSPSPRMKASKNISFASSLFSLFFLQTMMFKQFGQSDSQAYKSLLTIALGTTVFALLAGLGIFMIVKARRKMKQEKEQH